MDSTHHRPSLAALRQVQMATFAACLCLAAGVSLRAQEDSGQNLPANYTQGQLYVAGVTGQSNAVVNDRVLGLKNNTLVNAHGTVIETQAKSADTVVLSNGVGVYIGSDSRLEVSSFQQQKFKGDSAPGAEPSISHSNFNFPRGFVGICAGQMAAGSSMVYNTPSAAVTVNGGMMAIQTQGDQTTIFMLKGHSTVQSGSKGEQTVPEGQKMVITTSPNGMNTISHISPIDARQLQTLQSTVGVACQARKTVLFSVFTVNFNNSNKPGGNNGNSGENGGVNAHPVIPPKPPPTPVVVSPAAISK